MSDYNPYQWKYYQKDHNKYLAYHRAKSKERYWENKGNVSLVRPGRGWAVSGKECLGMNRTVR